MNPITAWLSKAFGPYSKTVAAFVSYAIAFVVQQESLPHPFSGNWWVGLLTGAGVVLGVFGVPNQSKSAVSTAPVVPATTQPPIGPG